MKPFDEINFKEPENSKEIKRPFTIKVEESVARDFIKSVKGQGLFVRETIVKMMKEFSKQFPVETPAVVEVPKECVKEGKENEPKRS